MRSCQGSHPTFGHRLGAVALLILLAPAAALAAWIDLGDATPVTVEMLEDNGSRSVYSITLGGFEATPVEIQGRTWYEITLSGESTSLEAGLPALPDVRRALAIPDDRAMTVRVIDSEYTDLADMPVAPSKGNLLRSVDPATVAHTFDPFYTDGDIWPEQIVVGEDPHILRDMRGLLVDANMFQYLPETETLRVYTRLVIEVADAGPGAINVLDRSRAPEKVDPQFADIYANHFINVDGGSRYVPVGEDGGLLIISYDAFASAMQPLVEWKQQKGMDTRLVTLSETGSSFSQIKSYITTQYNTWAPAYVLLVGDIGQIPIGSDSDPEYSTIVGSDDYPELFVGRFSAENTDQVNTQVLRTITYERDEPAGGVWPQYGTGIASNQGPGDDDEYDDEHEDVIRQKLLNYGYLGVDQIYDPSGTATMVATALNEGRGIINYTGHGSTTGWGSTGFSSTHVNALVNDNMLPFICSVACNNGTFTGTCFAETWLRATNGGIPTGAIATYMSYISQSWDPPMCGQDEVVDLLVRDEKRTVGGLFFNGSCLMMDEYGSTGANEFLNWTIFGDPSVHVRTKAAQAMALTHSGVLLIGMSEYTVETGTPGAVCALYADGVLYGSTVADAAGQAVIAMAAPPTEPMDLLLTVTAYNMVTAQETVAVLPPEGPYLVFEGLTVSDPDGDQDGLLDVGETAFLDIELENVGVDMATGLDATLASEDPYISIAGATATYPDIPAGGFASGDLPFEVTVLGGAPDGHVAQFTLAVAGGGHAWDVAFNVPVQAPALTVVSSQVDDSVDGNDSGTADAGEVVMLQVRLANLGAADAADLTGVLSCAHPDVTILGSDGGCALVPAGLEGYMGDFEVQIAVTYPEPAPLVLDLAVTAASGHTAALQFELAVGGWFDDVEADRGWTCGAPGDDASSGQWVMADPVGTEYNGATVQPEDDHTPDPGAICFVTGNANPGDSAGTNDVDGGATTLLSPVFDLAYANSATISYWRWYTNDLGNNPGESWWTVEVTNNGTDWVQLENTQDSNAAWQQMTFELSSYVTLSSTVQLRFIASDINAGTLVEAAMDDFLLDANYGTSTAVDDARELPAVLALGESYPNPFNPATKITFAVPRTGEVDLAIYDIAGRRVATLVRGMVAAGHHEVTWQGRDDRGGVVASGVYFSRLTSGGEIQTTKMTLLK